MASRASRKAREARWDITIALLIANALKVSTQEALSILGVALHSTENAMARMKYRSTRLREEIVRLMVKKGITEFRSSRMTWLRLDPVLAMKKDQAGKKQYEILVGYFGKTTAGRLVDRTKIIIPAHSETTYAINEDALSGLSEEDRNKIPTLLGNSPRLFCGDVPKRAKEGKSRAPRKLTKKS